MRKAQYLWNYHIAPNLKLQPQPQTIACPSFFYMSDEEFDKALQEMKEVRT